MTRKFIEHIRNTEWYREGGAIAPYYIAIPWLGQFARLEGACYYKNFNAYGYYNKAKAYRLVKRCLEDSKIVYNNMIAWHRAVKKEIEFFRLLEHVKLTTLDNATLKRYYEQLLKLRKEVWHYGYLPESFNIWDQHFLLQILKKFPRVRLTQKELTILTTPSTPDFILSMRRDMLKLMRNARSLRLLSKTLARRYFWLENTWAACHELDEKYWIKRVRATNPTSLAQEINIRTAYLKTVAMQWQKILDKHKLPTQVRQFFQIARDIGAFRDARKQHVLVENGWSDRFLREFTRRFHMPYELLKYAMPWDFPNKVRSAVYRRQLRSRESMIISLAPWKAEVIHRKRAAKIRSYFEEKFVGQSEMIQGVIANPGRIIGAVRTVIFKSDFGKMRKGDILVTQMTRPEFMPVIHKAGAIVTDEGGITCHAANISREMNIPCLIATQVATKVLKDGDRVEVDAVRGIVRKI